MATIRQIVLKAVDLKAEVDKLDKLQQDRDTAKSRYEDAVAKINAQMPIVVALRDELKALINE